MATTGAGDAESECGAIARLSQQGIQGGGGERRRGREESERRKKKIKPVQSGKETFSRIEFVNPNQRALQEKGRMDSPCPTVDKKQDGTAVCGAV
eukprot:807098-Rhodomonas_salina.2